MTIAQLTSRIDAVKIYAAGATIARIAELRLTPDSLPEQVEIASLPLALDDTSVRVRVEFDGGNVPIASDIRIGLAVPPPSETPNPPADEELRAAKAEVQRLEDIIALIDNEMAVLSGLEVPDRPEGEPGKAPPPSPMSARLALANFSDEQIRARMQEKRETLEMLRHAKEHLVDLQQKQTLASTARNARPNELRKTAIVSLSYEGEFNTEQQTRLVIEYFVPGARWNQTYVCRLNSVDSTANIAIRALICQRTGEDWSGVRLELSTALPMAWCALPELPSLRLGKAQPVVKKTGWRRHPIGAEILFEDYDRQKKIALAAVDKHQRIANLFAPSVSRLQKITSIQEFEKAFAGAGAAMDEFADLEAMLAESEKTEEISEAIPMPMVVSEAPADAPEFIRRATLAIRTRATTPRALVGSFQQGHALSNTTKITDYSSNYIAYGLMRLGAANDKTKRGKLSLEQRNEVYLEILQRQKVVVNFDITKVVQTAVNTAESCLDLNLPPGGINVREVAASFDYAYSANGRIDIPSDGQFHSVALTNKTTNVDLRYIVVPRENTNVFRIAELRNPLPAPLLSGPGDVYVDGEYILSSNIATVPPKGKMEIGLGVEQAIKVARNTFYQETRSGTVLVAFNEMQHKIEIEITNRLSKEARIEVRERIPVPQEGAKVDVQIDRVSPAWEKYEQEKRGTPIRGGYRWRVKVPGGRKANLSADYTIKTYVDSEIIGGNRRE
ncbi:DUF4139 domain-containing protein [Microseira sp. BLCC-F43]|uniref:DUF4139 domain-containing protein n=1 Tax=Microseira sp. BLCC-F43 TaxID=3153602 RepID=UPI0035B8BA6F